MKTKMKFLKIIVSNFITLFIALLIFISCSKEDILIDNYSNNFSFIFQTSDNNLQKISTKDNLISEILQNFNFGKIDVMKNFRGKFYFISSENKKIFVIKENTFEIEEIDFSDLNLVPIDICFPNATDAYVAHSNENCVTILDLTNNKISEIRITVSGFAGKIAGVGNQVHLTIPDKNLVEIIDTRTNKVEKSLTVSDKPTFVEFFDDGTKSVVISMGNGKEINSSQEMTSAKFTVIDVLEQKIISEMKIGDNAEVSIIPTSLAISPRFIYISATSISSVASTVWRTSVSNFNSLVSMSRNSASFIGYSPKHNIVYLLEESRSQRQLTLFTVANSRIKTVPFIEIPTVIIDE